MPSGEDSTKISSVRRTAVLAAEVAVEAQEVGEKQIINDSQEVKRDSPPPSRQRSGFRAGGGGTGGRRRVRVKRRSEETKEEGEDEVALSPRLTWLSEGDVDLSAERTLWRINRAIASCGSVREALGVVEEMKAAGLNAANEGTYIALITVCRRQGQGERALVVYEAMKQAGVKPGMLAFNTLIACCQQAQRLEDAFKLKSEMEELGVKPDVVTYTSLMALVVKAAPYRGRTSPAQRFQQAMDLYEEMSARGVTPDVITFNTLMYAAAQAKLPGKVLELYGMMSSAPTVQPNHFTFSTLLESVGSGGRLKAALQVFNEMRAAGVPPTTTTFNFLLEACATAPQPDSARAWSLYEEMCASKDVAPNAETLNHLINASSKGGDHPGAVRAYALMQERGLARALNPSTYNKLIHSAAQCNSDKEGEAKEESSGSVEKAFELYSGMRSAGIAPDVFTLGTLVSACGREGDLPRALAVLEEFEGLNVRPNQAVYHALIGACGQAGQWEKGLEMFRTMQEKCKSEPPTLGSYNVALDACFGREGAEGAVRIAAEEGGRPLDLDDPAIQAAIHLYEEGARSGMFRNFDFVGELWRCDVRNLTCATSVACIAAWLLAVRESKSDSESMNRDIVLVTGTDKGGKAGRRAGGSKRQYPKLFLTAARTMQAFGLKPKSLQTLTMQALTVEAKKVQQWVASGGKGATGEGETGGEEKDNVSQ